MRYGICGMVGDREKFVAKRYLEDLGYETSIYIEKKHSGQIKGCFFQKIEELLDENYIYDEFNDLDTYILYLINLYDVEISDLIEKLDIEDEDENSQLSKIKAYYEEHPEDKKDEVYLALEKLQDGETLFVLHDAGSGVTKYDTDKTSLILDMISDGQRQLVFENIEEALDSIADNGLCAYGFAEELVCFVFEQMRESEKEAYINEYEESKEEAK